MFLQDMEWKKQDWPGGNEQILWKDCSLVRGKFINKIEVMVPGGECYSGFNSLQDVLAFLINENIVVSSDGLEFDV